MRRRGTLISFQSRRSGHYSLQARCRNPGAGPELVDFRADLCKREQVGGDIAGLCLH